MKTNLKYDSFSFILVPESQFKGPFVARHTQHSQYIVFSVVDLIRDISSQHPVTYSTRGIRVQVKLEGEVGVMPKYSYM